MLTVRLFPGVTHADEMMYLFSFPAQMDGQQEVVKDRMVKMWTNFAIYGWERYMCVCVSFLIICWSYNIASHSPTKRTSELIVIIFIWSDWHYTHYSVHSTRVRSQLHDIRSIPTWYFSSFFGLRANTKVWKRPTETTKPYVKSK